MQWEFATQRGVGVMVPTGFLGQDDLDTALAALPTS
jgi:hypothetical protein